MFNLIADPFLNLFFTKLTAPSNPDIYLFIANPISELILTVLMVAILFIGSALILRPTFFPNITLPLPLPVISFSLGFVFIICFSMFFSSHAIWNPVGVKTELAHRYMQKNDVVSAYFIDPNYMPTGAKEFTYLKRYKGKDENVYLAIAKTYKKGLKDVAKNKTLAFVYHSMAMEIIRGKAFKGDLTKIIYLLSISTPNQLSVYLIPVKQTCDNAESTYAAAANIFKSFEKAKKERLSLDVDIVSENAQKIEILTKWASFSEKECIPIWNKYH